MGKIRIGFVGVGGMGQMAHLRNYVTIDDCQVVALAEIRQETAKLVAERYGIPRVYNDHREMLAGEKLDGIVASQPFNRHAILLPEIYGKVRHILTEKPLAVSVAAGERLAKQACDTGTVHMVGYHKRSDPAVIHANGVIEQWKRTGEMGPLKYVRITMPAGDWIAAGFTGLLNAGDKAGNLPVEPADPETIDLVLAPGLAFDRAGNRLGRGGGFFDRFLPLTRATVAGLCFSCQLIDEVPCSAGDVPVDLVVTELETIQVRRVAEAP